MTQWKDEKERRRILIGLRIGVFCWIGLAYLIFFDFEGFSDNRFFVPGLIAWVLGPFAFASEYRKIRRKK